MLLKESENKLHLSETQVIRLTHEKKRLEEIHGTTNTDSINYKFDWEKREKDYERKIEELQDYKNRLEGELHTVTSERNKFRDDLDNNKKDQVVEYETLNEQMLKIQNALANLKIENSNYKEQLEKIERIKEKNKILKIELDEKEKKIDMLKDEICKNDPILSNLQERLELMQSELLSIRTETDINARQDKKKAMMMEIESLQNKIRTMKLNKPQ